VSYNSSYKKWHKPNTSEKSRTYQGYYKVQNPKKYVGDPSLVVYRSSWEYSFCKFCDYSESVQRWSSEPLKIPYYDRVSKLAECRKMGLDPNSPKNWIKKNYNTDFWIEIKKPDDSIEKWFIEIKPKNELKKPVPPQKTAPLKEHKRFNQRAKTFLINEAKYAAMNEFAKRNNCKFYVFTEDELTRFGIIGGRFDLPKMSREK
jgi:hypothetical protein